MNERILHNAASPRDQARQALRLVSDGGQPPPQPAQPPMDQIGALLSPMELYADHWLQVTCEVCGCDQAVSVRRLVSHKGQLLAAVVAALIKHTIRAHGMGVRTCPGGAAKVIALADTYNRPPLLTLWHDPTWQPPARHGVAAIDAFERRHGLQPCAHSRRGQVVRPPPG